MACTPTPTSTVFSTSTSTSFTLSTITTSEVDTITSTSTSVWTSCLVENATASGGATCLSSTVGTSSTLIPIVTTVPITQTNTVPVNVPVQVPIQTLFSDCPSGGNSQPQQQQSSSQRDEDSSSTSTTQSHTRITVTSFITYSDSDGLHVSQSASVSDDGQLSPGGGGNSSSKANLGPIIGGVVGGVIAILALIGLVWYILWRRDQNRFLFDEEDEDGVYRPKSVGRRARRSLNLDDETKGLDTTAYQYGVVGSTNSPSTSPLPHSQFSSLGEYSHRRSLSREALMTAGGPSSSIPNSPQRLDIPLGGASRRISQNTSSSTRGESIMMTNQPVQNRPSDDTVPWGHHPRPSSSLLEAPMVYPPGATGGTGFYQQYGPLEPQPVTGATGSASPPPTASASRGMHKPPLEPSLIPAIQPLGTHQSLLAAAGLAEPSTSRIPVVAAPPPGAAGARPYVEHRDTLGDLHSAVMASADRVATSPTPSSGSAVDVGFGRQRRAEKTPRVETPRSPVIQHEDAGQAPASNTAQEPPPPAYSPS